MENLIQFYKDLLAVFGLETDEAGNIFLRSKKRGKLPISIEGRPLVLPTRENIRNCVQLDENGKPQLVKHLFNPLEENALRGENKSLLRLKEIIERHVNNSFAGTGEVAFTILDKKNEEINDPDLIRLLSIMNKYKAPGIRRMVDEKTTENWYKIYKEIVGLETNHLFLHTFLKRGGEINGEKQNRTGVLTFPVYEKLDRLKKDESLYGIKLRNKDKHVYKSFHEYTFDADQDEILRGIQFGSKNDTSPAFHVLMIIYDFVKNKINDVINILKRTDYDVDYLQELELKDLPVKIEDLEKLINDLRPELKMIPSESDLLLSAEAESNQVSRVEESEYVQPTTNQLEEDDDDWYVNALRQQTSAVQQPQYPPQGYQQPATQQYQQPSYQSSLFPNYNQQPYYPQQDYPQQPQQQGYSQYQYPYGYGYGY